MKLLKGDNWIETYYEVVSFITLQLMLDEKQQSYLIKDRYENQGTGGMYELAEEITNKFEKKYENYFWNGEFFDKIEEFLNKEVVNYENNRRHTRSTAC